MERRVVDNRVILLGLDTLYREAMKHSAWQLTVQDFWHPDVWTSAAYRKLLALGGRCPELPPRAGPNG